MASDGTTGEGDDELAARVLGKLRAFVEGLDTEERGVLAALLAPGVAQAYHPEPEVSGFVAADWAPARLPETLAEQVRAQQWTIAVSEAEGGADL